MTKRLNATIFTHTRQIQSESAKRIHVAYVAIQGWGPHEILNIRDRWWARRLLLVLLLATVLLRSCSLALPLDTTGAASTVWRGESKVDVFLGVETDDEGGDVDSLLANTGSNERLD